MKFLARNILVLVVFVCVLPAVASAGTNEDKFTPQQMRAEGESMVAGMRAMRDNAEAALRKARADKDLARLDCINEALIALKGVLKLAEDYLYDLQAELKQGNKKAVQSSFVKIKIAKKKTADLDARIRSCGGPTEEGIVEGKPIIERTVDSDLPTQDPLEGLETEAVFVEKPSATSPYH